MLSTNLTHPELLGFLTQTVVDELEGCGLAVCQQHIVPAKPRSITCCPCSCGERGGLTVTTWLDRVTFQHSRTRGLRCVCTTIVEVGLQVARCWPTTTKCGSAAQQEAVNDLLAASQCITNLLCCDNVMLGAPPTGRPMCEAVDPGDIVTLQDCDNNQWFEGNRERCCAGFEVIIRIL